MLAESGDSHRVAAAAGGPCQVTRLAGPIVSVLLASPVPSGVPASTPRVWEQGPPWANGRPEQRTHCVHLGVPLTGRNGVHLSPI